MRIRKEKCVMALLFISLDALAIEEFKKKPYCDGNQMEMNACASEQFSYYDSILNKLYKEQIDHFGGNSNRAKMLIDAQRAWIKFRDADCSYDAGRQEDSGSIWPLAHFTCLANRTKQRAIEVEDYVKCRENGCP